jgi:hypothetical protein
MLNVEMAQLVLTKKRVTVVHVDQVFMEPHANFVNYHLCLFHIEALWIFEHQLNIFFSEHAESPFYG